MRIIDDLMDIMGARSCMIGAFAGIVCGIVIHWPLAGATVFVAVWFVSYICMVLHANHKELTALRAEMTALRDELENARRTEKTGE